MKCVNVIMFNERDKYLFKVHFFNSVCKCKNLHKHSLIITFGNFEHYFRPFLLYYFDIYDSVFQICNSLVTIDD